MMANDAREGHRGGGVHGERRGRSAIIRGGTSDEPTGRSSE
jgi:hypothetical protein